MTDEQRDAPETSLDELDALSSIVKALRPLDRAGRERVVLSVITLLDIAVGGMAKARTNERGSISTGEAPLGSFSEDRSPSPKEFLLEKKPGTDVDRVACLGYYLAHYRETPHFKTLDISKLNTEAAQLKFSNAAYAVENATKAGLLVPAVKGNKQLSAIGEMYVQALPDRAAAKAVLADGRKKRPRKSKTSKPTEGGGDT